MKPFICWFVLAASLTACVVPPDVPVCRALEPKLEKQYVPGVGDILVERPNPTCQKAIGEPTCGFCVWTISDKTAYIGENQKTRLFKKPWSTIRREAILTPPETYARLKGFVIDICKKSGDCSKDISRWRLKLNSLDQ